MKQLPKNWYCEVRTLTKDYDHPIIKYLNKIYHNNKQWCDGTAKYYGVNGDGSTYSNELDKDKIFYNCTLITLDQFLEATNPNQDKNIIGYKLIKPEYVYAVKSIINNDTWFKSYFYRNINNYGYNIANSYNEESNCFKINKAGVLNLWFEPVYDKPKLYINNHFEIKFFKDYVTIDNDANFYNKKFWEAALIIAEHTKAGVYVGCDAASGEGKNKWLVDIKTINEILKRLK